MGTGGSPSRLGQISVLIFVLVILSLAFIISATEYPRLLPKLNASLGLLAASHSAALTCASARSLTCTCLEYMCHRL